MAGSLRRNRAQRAGQRQSAVPARQPVAQRFLGKCLQANVRGALARQPGTDAVEIFRLLDSNGCNFAFLSETWGDSPYVANGWSVLSQPRRSGRRGGGVAIATRHSVAARRIDVPPAVAACEALEVIVAELHFPPMPTPVTAVSLYMPEGATHDALIALESLLQILAARRGFLLVGGDFNCHHVRWDKSVPASANSEALVDIMDAIDLVSMNTGVPTHCHDASHRLSAPDVTFCDPTSASDATWSVLPGSICGSDHSGIIAELWPTLSHNGIRRAPCERVWDTRNADWDTWKELTDWDGWSARTRVDLANGVSIDDVYRSWLSVFQELAMKHIGVRDRHPTSAVQHGKGWWSDALLPFIRERDRARRLHLRHPTDVTRDAYRAASNAARARVREAKANYLRALADQLDADARAAPKRFWDAFNRECRPQASGSGPPIRIADGSHVAQPSAKADVLNQHFAGVSSSRLRHAQSCGMCEPDAEVLEYFRAHAEAFELTNDDSEHTDHFTLEQLQAEVNELRWACAGGPDMVLACMVKNGSPAMLRSILLVINASWSRAALPRLWKAANVRALLKRGIDVITAAAFRPISLLSIIGKLAERLVHRELRERVESLGCLPPSQSGFRRGHSTLDGITRLSLALHSAFAQRLVAVGAFIDVEKAYDTVWRLALLVKLHKVGIRGRLLRWIANFLSDRVQRVCVDGMYSSWLTLEDGVPQGSVLSCTLYIIFAHDVLSQPVAAPRDAAADDGVEDAAFADDFAVWTTASNAPTACSKLQPVIDRIAAWARRNVVHLSTTKSVFTVFDRLRSHVHHDVAPGVAVAADGSAVAVKLNGVPLKRDSAPTYLGVRLDPQLDWRPHIKSAATRATRTLNAIAKIVRHLDGSGATASVVVRLYKALVRPVMEYGCQVWLGAPPMAREPLERVQHRALVLASSAWQSTPREALEVLLHVQPLEIRWSMLLLRWEARILRMPSTHPLHKTWTLSVLPALAGPLDRLQRGWSARYGASVPQRLHHVHRSWNFDYEDANRVEPMATALERAPIAARPSLTVCPVAPLAAAAWTTARIHEIRASSALAVVAFTDGSCSDSGVGSGAFSMCPARPPPASPAVETYGCALGPGSNSFRAELFAIVLCLLRFWCRFSRQARPYTLHVFADSRSALDSVACVARPSAHIALVNATQRLLCWLRDEGLAVHLYWVPSHCGISGNDAVDAAAKAALLRPPEGVGAVVAGCLLVDYSTVRSAIAAASRARWADDWVRCPRGAHLRSVLPTPVDTSDLWTGPRQRDRLLCWLRLGSALNSFLHGVFPRQFPSPHCPFAACGGVETVEHFLLRCSGYARHRATMLHAVHAACPGRIVSIDLLLGASAPSGARSAVGDAVAHFVVATRRSLLLPR